MSGNACCYCRRIGINGDGVGGAVGIGTLLDHQREVQMVSEGRKDRGANITAAL